MGESLQRLTEKNEILEKYEILEKLGEGGMGTVYRVRHRLLDEIRVVKMMRSALRGDPDLAARFLREAQAAIQLRHPRIAQLFDFTTDREGNAFMVMEFIDGLTVEELLERGPPSIALTLEIAVQTLRALDYLHRKSFVHRDVSPDNLMLTRDVDNRPFVKLIDLGITKSLGEGTGRFTATSLYLGKIRYSSPEQLEGTETGKVDGRSDLYSFGVVLYELLTGHSPISGSSPRSIIGGHLYRPPRTFEESDPAGRVPAELRQITMQALAKRPEARPASAAEFSQCLSSIRDAFPMTEEIQRQILALIASRRPGCEPTPPEQADRSADNVRPRVTTPVPWRPPASSEVTELLSDREAPQDGADFQQTSLLEEIEERVQQKTAERERQKVIAATAERIEEALERRRRARRRQEAASRIERCLEAGELNEAESLLDHCRHEFGAEPPFPEFHRKLERRQQEVVMAQLVAQAQQLIEREELGSALAPLRLAVQIDPEDAGIRRLLEETRANFKRQQRQRQQAIVRIQELLAGTALEEAGRELDAAVEQFGDQPPIPDLRQKLERLEREARVEKLLAEARELIDSAELGMAIECLREAHAILPERVEVVALLEDVRAELERKTVKLDVDKTVQLDVDDVDKTVQLDLDETIQLDVDKTVQLDLDETVREPTPRSARDTASLVLRARATRANIDTPDA